MRGVTASGSKHLELILITDSKYAWGNIIN